MIKFSFVIAIERGRLSFAGTVCAHVHMRVWEMYLLNLVVITL